MKLLRIGIVLVSLMLLAMPPVVEAGETRVEETDPSFVWTQYWDSTNNAQIAELLGVPGNLSGGTAKGTGSGADNVEITFSGTGIALIHLTAPSTGIAQVKIDGVSYDDIDMYSSDTVFQVKTVIATDLTNTQHVLTIICSGQKNPASTRHGILIDAVDVSAPFPAAFTVSDLTISPATVGVGQSVTITADVTNSGDLEGTHTVILKIDDAVVKNKDVTVAGGATENVSFTVNKDTVGVYQVAVDNQTGSFAVFRVTLTFRDWQRNALTNTSIYYGFSSGQETNYLGTTDNEGKITSDNTELANQTIYFKTSDGKCTGSTSMSAAGGKVTVDLTEKTTLTFRDRQGNALANTSIYYGLSSGQETNYLGTTDNEGKITSDNPELANQTIYFRTSDGKYAGSTFVGAAGSEVTAELTGVPEISEFPILWVVAAVTIIAVAIGALLLVKKRK